MKVLVWGDGVVSDALSARDNFPGRQSLLRHAPDWVYGTRKWAQTDPEFTDRVVDAYWRGPVDGLFVEARWPAFPPEDHTKELNSFYQQGVLLRDWVDGQFNVGNRRPPLFILDFDLNLRRSFGVGGSTSIYTSGAVWRRITPWMDEVLKVVWQEAILLTEGPPELSAVTGQRGTGRKYAHADLHRYEVAQWRWGYPVDYERQPLPWTARDLDLVFSGSDYARRGPFWRYYVTAAQHGWSVLATGNWNDRRMGSEDEEEYRGRGFQKRCEAEGVRFTGMVPLTEMHSLLARSRAAVQIVKRHYAVQGVYTHRINDAVAAGTLPFVDSAINGHSRIVLSPWCFVTGWADLARKLDDIRDDAHYAAGVQRWREHLLAEVGTPARAAAWVEDVIRRRQA